jgi:hypothetical protein
MSDVLAKLRGDRVFSVELTDADTTLRFVEECDCHFQSDLTKGDVKQLIAELVDLVGIMEDAPCDSSGT